MINDKNNDCYIVKSGDNIDYLQFNKLLEYQDKLTHAVFLKKHDIGFDLFSRPEIRENAINRISKEFNINKENIIQAKQEHTDIVQNVENIEKNILKGVDGFYTNKSNIASIVTFADCIPVMIYDPKENVYANIHSGWKGVCNKIVIKGINKLVSDYGCKANNLIVCIGPNIGKDNFLVNDDVVSIYKDVFKNNIEYKDYIDKYPIIFDTDLFNEKGKQYRIDNNLLLELMLKNAGVLEENIFNCNICTVSSSDLFHSRRVEGTGFEKNGNLMMIK